MGIMSALHLFGSALCIIAASYDVYGMSPARPYPYPHSTFQYIEMIKQCKIDYALDIDNAEIDAELSNYTFFRHGYGVYAECIKTQWNQDREYESKGNIYGKIHIGLQLDEENKKEMMVAEPNELYNLCKEHVSETTTTLWEYNCNKNLENKTITSIGCYSRCYVFDYSQSLVVKREELYISSPFEKKGTYDVRSGTSYDTVTKEDEHSRTSHVKKGEEFRTSNYEAIAIYAEEE